MTRADGPATGTVEDRLASGQAGGRRGLLRIRGLDITSRTRDGARTLLRDVDLDLGTGDTIGIVGESGSGKSLTARAIVGLLPAGLHARGSIAYDGMELLGRSERGMRKIRGARISLLLQDPFTMLNPLQTAGVTLAESLPRGARRNRAAVRKEIIDRLDEVGLAADVADRCPFQLSGGMRQRVALAAALARDPELLIADEPTTALDVTTQAEVLALLKGIRRSRGMSLIFITHDLRVAFSVCDRIQVMYAGSVVERAPTAELRGAPAHPYTLGLLLAEPPADRYVDRLSTIPGSVPAPDTVADRCAFADRCDWAAPECTSARPVLSAVGAARWSSCTRLEQIRDQLVVRTADVDRSPSTGPDEPATPPILTVTDLCKTYRTTPLLARAQKVTALDKVGFTIGAGESVGLVGETGSGKTTIARCVLGLARPDTGSIELTGIEAADHRRLSRAQRHEVRRSVQIVFQDPYASLNPALNVGSMLREVIAMRGGGTDPAGEISRLLARVGLPGAYARRRPADLSGGERQRVAIARAIAMRPALLLCDEPVAALDVSTQAQILELLREIQRTDNMSMLFITHDIAVVRQMTTRVLVLHRGRVVESGPTAGVLNEPAHDYTRRLLAATPGRADD